jgi:hypothetical protein
VFQDTNIHKIGNNIFYYYVPNEESKEVNDVDTTEIILVCRTGKHCIYQRSNKKSKNRQYNGKNKRDKKTNNNLQNTKHKPKNRATRTPLKPGVHSNDLKG